MRVPPYRTARRMKSATERAAAIQVMGVHARGRAADRHGRTMGDEAAGDTGRSCKDVPPPAERAALSWKEQVFYQLV